MQSYYIAIDLKSFYASQECVERELDPLTTNLVVADESRTDKTVCLAVSPSLKAYGVSGRARLFEVKQRIAQVNALRRGQAPKGELTGSSTDDTQLRQNPALAVDFIIAKPRMAHYLECSTKIHEIYLRYIAPEDIHVYSIDEVFIYATPYLKTYNMTPYELARMLIHQVLEVTGITATAGIGTNLYLSKIAMDIVAKKLPADKYGVRIAQLDEQSYRQQLWDHRPLTDFWRVGPGYAKKLERNGLRTMGDIARCSLGRSDEFHNEDLLYKLFGVNAELLIDHAWGWEPCTIAHIKAYRPTAHSISSGQVLHRPYSFAETGIVVREMADDLAMNLLEKGLVTNQIVLTVGYDISNVDGDFSGTVTTDHYGRKVPRHAHGTLRLHIQTASVRLISQGVMDLFRQIVDPKLTCRRINLTAAGVIPEARLQEDAPQQLNLFEDPSTDQDDLEREKRRQQAVLSIRKKYGKNAILKGMNLQEGATAKDRNEQIGGHKA